MWENFLQHLSMYSNVILEKLLNFWRAIAYILVLFWFGLNKKEYTLKFFKYMISSSSILLYEPDVLLTNFSGYTFMLKLIFIMS